MARAGTAGEGDHNEYFTPALLALKFIFNDKIIDFSLEGNVANFKSWDDLHIWIKTQNTEYNFAFQLKHKANKDYKLQLPSFEATTGKFSLPIYYNDFKTFDDNIKKKFHFILYTNGGLDQKKLNSYRFNKIKMFVNDQCPGAQFFNTGIDSQIFGVASECDQDYNGFLSKCSIYASQKSVSEIENEIKCICVKELNMNSELCAKFVIDYINYFKNWHLKYLEKRVIFKKHTMIKMFDFLLNPFIIIPRALTVEASKSEFFELIGEAISKFEITTLKEKTFNLLSDELYHKLNNLEVVYQAKNYHLLTKFQDISDVNDVLKAKIRAFHFNKPLFVKMSNDNRLSIEIALKLLKKESMCLVLVNNILTDFLGLNIFYNLKNLELADYNVYKKIIEKASLSLQGRNKISLEQFIKSDKNFINTVTINEVIEMSQNFTIGENNVLGPNYISRFVSTITFELKELVQISDLLVIECGNFYKEIENFLLVNSKIYCAVQYLTQLDNIYAILSTRLEENDFFNILRMNFARNIHRFKAISPNCLQWCSTVGRVDELQQRKSINRTYIHESYIFDNFKNRCNVICSLPGMGKTFLMNYLRNNCPNSYWPITINCTQNKSFLTEEHTNIRNILNYLINLANPNPDSFTKAVIDCFGSRKKLMFFWDGLDELSSQKIINNTLECIKIVENNGFIQWISCRPELKNVVEQKFEIFTIDIAEISEDEQKKYIEDRLKGERSSEDISMIISMLYKNVDLVDTSQILGVPLQLKMLTEICQKNRYRSPNFIDELKILTKRYRYFFEAKCEFNFKKTEDLSDLAVQNITENYFRKYQAIAVKSFISDEDLSTNLDTGSLYALEEDYQSFVNDYRKSSGDYVGLVIGMDSNNYCTFEHNTYGEFCVASWMAKKWRGGLLSKFSTFIFDEKYCNVRYFFDMILAENYPTLLAILHKNYNATIDLNERDEADRSAAHLACSWGLTHPRLHLSVECDSLSDLRTVRIKTKLNLDRGKIKNDIKLGILIAGVDLIPDKLFNWTPLQYANATSSLAIIEGYNLNFDILQQTQLFNDLDEIAYYAITYDYVNIARQLGDRLKTFRIFYPELKQSLHNSVMAAVRNESVTVIKYLVEELKVDFINTRNVRRSENENDIDLVNYIILAIRSKNLKAVIYVVNEFSIDISSPFPQDKSVLSLAIEWNAPSDILEYLVENGGASMYITHPNNSEQLLAFAVKNNNFWTVKYLIEGIPLNFTQIQSCLERALYASIGWNKSNEITKYLLQLSIDIKWRHPNNSETFLMLAVEKENFEIVEYLIGHYSIDINELDYSGNSALAYAARWNQSVDIIQLLIRNTANIEWKNFYGQNILSLAIKQNNFNFIKYFIEELKITLDSSVLIEALENDTSLMVKKYLLDKSMEFIDIPTNLMRIIYNGDIQFLIYFVDKCNITFEEEDTQGFTALANCIRWNKSKKLITFLMNYSNLSWKHSQTGATYLMLASKWNHLNIVQDLIEQLDFNPNEVDKNNYTALDYTFRSRALTVFEFFLDNYEIRCNDINSVIKYLIDTFNKTLLSKFVEKLKININSLEINQCSLLYYAVDNNNLTMVGPLCSMKANVNWKHPLNGRTPLILAVLKQHIYIVKDLVGFYKADLNHMDCDGQSALNYAINNEHIKRYLEDELSQTTERASSGDMQF